MLGYFGMAQAFIPTPGDGEDPPPPPLDTPAEQCLADAYITFNATPHLIDPGESSTLRWSFNFPSGCTMFYYVDFEGRWRGLHASEVVQPAATTLYKLRLPMPGGFRYFYATVAVKLPHEVYIDDNTDRSKKILIQALDEGGHIITLSPNVDLDLSGHQYIPIAGNTTLKGTRNAQNYGPRLFTTTRPQALFVIVDNNITLEGFRLHGPDFGLTDEGDPKGLVINSAVGITIKNMDIAGWNIAGIYIRDQYERISSPEEIKISDSFFHHNQHSPGGNGYGIAVKHGAKALIERNVFDFNRHAIASEGAPGTGYVAQHNLVLKGGGVHCLDVGPIDFICGHTHQFDVHGSKNRGQANIGGQWAFGCWDTDTLDTGQYNCGPAGESFHIIANAFQYTKDNAFKLRGTPTDGAYVHNNIFAHGDIDDAVYQEETGLVLWANTTGVDTFGQYGVCDFDGDGTDDLFLATGVSWWYASGGKMHWTFLKAATERLAQVGLGDFDDDGKCDVVAGGAPDPLQIASGGTGDWKVLIDSRGNPLVNPFDHLRFGDFNGDGRTDIFYRGDDGQWQIISPGVEGAPGVYDWTPIQSSSIPLHELRFGHFNQDRITDVVGVDGGKWSVSFGGRSPWTQLNRIRGESLQHLLIGDIDKNGIDDMVRYRWLRRQLPLPGGGLGGDMGIWEVTWNGNGTNWIRLNTYTAPVGQLAPTSVPAFLGRFDGPNSASKLLTIRASDRMGMVYNLSSQQFENHSLYPY